MALTDETLVRRTLGGNKDAFGQLVARYQQVVYGLAYHFTRNASDAQDLAQEAFLQAYLKLDQLNDPAKFAHWLRCITVNLGKMWLRRAKPEVSSWESLKERPPNDSLITREPQEVHELRQTVRDALDALSEKNRLAVTLYYMDGLTQKEISHFLEVPLGTIKSRLHEARKHLRKELRSRGFGREPSIAMVQESLQPDRLPDDFRTKVEEMLKDTDALVRRKAVHVLQEHHSEDPGVESLIIEAAQDEDRLVRERAIQALGWIRCEQAALLLVASLKDTDFQVRRRAAWSLNRIGTEEVVSEVLKLLSDPDAVVRRQAVDTLKGICTEAAVPALLQALQHDTDTGVRERIVQVLAEIEREDVADALVGLLSDEEPRIRQQAMDALCKMKPVSVAPTLLSLLDEENLLPQQRVIELLGLLKYEGAEDRLIQKLENPNPDIVIKAAEALGRMRAEKSTEPLIRRLQEPIVDTRTPGRAAYGGHRVVGEAIAKALGEIGDPSAVPALCAYLERLTADGTGASLSRMMAVIRALGRIGDARAVPLLVNYLDHARDIPATSLPDHSRWQWIPVREVLEALARIGDAAAIPHVARLVQGGYFIGETAIGVLGHLGAAAIPILSQVLVQKEGPADHWLDKRWRAAQALGEAGHPDALEPLRAALQDEARVVRFHAAQALGKLGSEESIPWLREALQDEDAGVRKAARDSLKRLGIPESELPAADRARKRPRKSKRERIAPERFRGRSYLEPGLRLPAKDSLRRAVLRKLVEEHFEKGRVYTEKEVDTIIHRVYEDHCSVRRYLVDYGMMSRERGEYTVQQ